MARAKWLLLTVFLALMVTCRASESPTLTLLTHDSFNISESVLATFEAEHGVSVALLPAGDAGRAHRRLRHQLAIDEVLAHRGARLLVVGGAALHLLAQDVLEARLRDGGAVHRGDGSRCGRLGGGLRGRLLRQRREREACGHRESENT